MKTLYRNNTILLALLTSLSPAVANKIKREEKESPKTTCTLITGGIIGKEGKGKLKLKGKILWDENISFSYTCNLLNLKINQPLFKEVTKNADNGDEKKELSMVWNSFYQEVDAKYGNEKEQTLSYLKSLLEEVYIQYEFDTDSTQSIQFGIVPDVYGKGGKLIGINFISKFVEISLDAEGIARIGLGLKKQEDDHMSDDSKPSAIFKRNKSGFGSVKVKWSGGDTMEEMSVAFKIAKNDFEENYKIGSYCNGIILNFKFNKCPLNLIKGITFSYTNVKKGFSLKPKLDANEKKIKGKYEDDKLITKPGFTLGVNFGKISVYDGKIDCKVEGDYLFCDTKGEKINDDGKKKNSFGVAVNLGYKKKLGSVDLKIGFKMDILRGNTDFSNYEGANPSFDISVEVPLASYYQ